ncbi:MAG: UDP-N-acetylmuramoyl-L-alanyl-D-glutamate--2,6-diaminopimelate ligase [Candidatus Pacebacteria bacterium]|jgi:UDP-N-acetylmuramoyl-L-alanyl-D-glutamate--2,6-diaminopimelate ligase|nr:UDP-N-acetylmuramoyl-L-alanyl-D-glutamate--2,6-diaminopimelate ligase [Candidatus Paceibacterota bacterium]MBT3512310.1 UDP-N-acetylmuramoyl-L-alanyl-D-glutamate--2,6-diaminopimelate ligase [Candidatus Paceibacterota bacterium]MBT4004833.1 UDP-N-acetylmuramoyl-L-alanyl-D-glutamate--2,6-diaminopimelate ligase [Candidatus Paceibacterota bacterium]MBT4358460.1 UDP-N-acetylmuramoyl-L-alanyl-D-glutamate--2,6-diaminopimelate ligase [Candidatus Paceibacterota bacterium]MBT4681115.1 UDP-N-acetylmura
MKTIWKIFLYKIKYPFHFIKTGVLKGLFGQIKYKFPAKNLKIITITGTDGKTTSSTMLYHILKRAGKKTALISTVAAYIGAEKIETGLHVTSPDPLALHRLIRRMVDANVEYLVLEVTSHGAYQSRIWGINPILAGLTNISHEHLDYHLTPSEYLKAKAMILNKAEKVIINADDNNHQVLKSNLRQSADKVISYSATDKLPRVISSSIKNRFSEKYNQMNARLVTALATELDIDKEKIATALQSFPDIVGRMQEVETNKSFRVLVDFAHTPQALKSALTALKSQLKRGSGGKLIAVYGAAGLRDQQKRPLMGEIGAQIADSVIFTAEDPRTEDVWSIIRQLKENLHQNLDKVSSIADRKEAISFAINKLAKKNDIVAILGKGHEQSMCFGKTEHPWSDVKVVKEILKQNK